MIFDFRSIGVGPEIFGFEVRSRRATVAACGAEGDEEAGDTRLPGGGVANSSRRRQSLKRPSAGRLAEHESLLPDRFSPQRRQGGSLAGRRVGR